MKLRLRETANTWMIQEFNIRHSKFYCKQLCICSDVDKIVAVYTSMETVTGIKMLFSYMY